jgi:hypothetical protein
MIRYRMLVYKSGDLLWQTHDIFAEDEVTAKQLAQRNFRQLVAELVGQKDPEIDDPTLERFCLYNGQRLICEIMNYA